MSDRCFVTVHFCFLAVLLQWTGRNNRLFYREEEGCGQTPMWTFKFLPFHLFKTEKIHVYTALMSVLLVFVNRLFVLTVIINVKVLHIVDAAAAVGANNCNDRNSNDSFACFDRLLQVPNKNNNFITKKYIYDFLCTFI